MTTIEGSTPAPSRALTDSRPRVLMVVGAYYPEVSGGGLQCRTLVRALGSRIEFAVLTTTAVAAAPMRDRIDGVLVYRLYVDPDRRWTKLRALAQLLRLGRELRRQCNIVHFHGFTQKMIVLAALARLLRLPVIQKMTSLGHDDPLSILRRQGQIAYRAFAWANRFVSISPAISDRYAASGLPLTRLVFIPNAVDLDRFSPADPVQKARLRKEQELPESAQIVTFVGFWSPEKAPDLLVEAWLSAVRSTRIPSFLLFLGASSTPHTEVQPGFAQTLRHRLDCEAPGRYKVVERTHAVAEYLQASDIFVLPSVREGLPNALLEAMAVGLACIATEIPGVTGWLLADGGNGCVVPARNVTALEKTLIRLLADEELRRNLGARARATVSERFSTPALADAYFDLYARLLASRASAVPATDPART